MRCAADWRRLRPGWDDPVDGQHVADGLHGELEAPGLRLHRTADRELLEEPGHEERGRILDSGVEAHVRERLVDETSTRTRFPAIIWPVLPQITTRPVWRMPYARVMVLSRPRSSWARTPRRSVARCNAQTLRRAGGCCKVFPARTYRHGELPRARHCSAGRLSWMGSGQHDVARLCTSRTDSQRSTARRAERPNPRLSTLAPTPDDTADPNATRAQLQRCAPSHAAIGHGLADSPLHGRPRAARPLIMPICGQTQAPMRPGPQQTRFRPSALAR